MSGGHSARPDFAGWVTETVNDGEGFRVSLKAKAGLRVVDSVQDLGVFENDVFGRVMILDGGYQITDRDEFIYHEMMAHAPLFAHGAVRDVLIIGGGDGGVAREVLRHAGVQRVTLVEIDQAVVDLAIAEFPGVAGGAFDDARMDLRIADGAAFVASVAGEYDVAIVDAPDPIGAGAVLFTTEFYAGCRGSLRPGGVLVTQSGMPFLTPDWLRGHVATLKDAFPAVSLFLSNVPSYTGGPMAHGFSSDTPALAGVSEQVLAQRFAAEGFETRYWTPAVHRGAFALPPYIEVLTR